MDDAAAATARLQAIVDHIKANASRPAKSGNQGGYGSIRFCDCLARSCARVSAGS